ncbi:hypothetical protein B0T25DRAFT_153698 [Lasiosphaeria hispida]|uniref:Uncharacterized protein n=1 Tax=Lasiosphaeria hispida TaxID=260671 RepID=A0AAJ0MGB3_9PEZI|nr:hypothetical protein B0T25DRAFT_153698 [Lasiosphaeria hispida]
MTSQNPSTPVKVPPSAANYTPATLDLDLRSQINMALIKEGCVTKIQEQLLHSLHAHHSNWPTVVQTHAITLLRSGEVSTFPALLRRVMEDVRQDTALAPGVMTNGALEVNGGRSKSSANGGGTPSAAGRGDGENGGGGSSNGNSGTATLSLAVPHSVVEDALKVTRDSLEMVCDIEENGAT